jgi:hypothetical protein
MAERDEHIPGNIHSIGYPVIMGYLRGMGKVQI